MGLVNEAFRTLLCTALPIYRKNMDRDRPPIAGQENIGSSVALMTLLTGVDHHLARLKYLRDIADHTPPLLHTPYFNWEVDTALSAKVNKLLFRKGEARLCNQLIELTACRDAIVHCKVHTIREL
jgi:hypothetical protein